MAAIGRRTKVGPAKQWPVKRSRGGLLGLAGAAALFALAGVLVVVAMTRAVSPWTLAAVSLAGLFAGAGAALALTGLAYFRLGYSLLPGYLVIRSGGRNETVPLEEIDGIYAGQRIGALGKIRGVSWPGYHVGTSASREFGQLRVFCTTRDADSLSIISTANRTLVLSPADPAAFRRELIQRIESSEARVAGPIGGSVGWLGFPGPAVAILVAVSGCLLLAGLLGILANYTALPELIALQVDPSGRPAPLSPRAEIFGLPLLGGVVLLLNGALVLVLRGRESAAAIVLCGTTCVVEAVVLLATLRLLP